MANDTEALVLSISADTRQIQRSLQRLMAESMVATDAVTKHFDGITRAGSRTASVIEIESRRISRGIAQSRVAAQQLTFQVNDLATAALSGGISMRSFGQQAGQIAQIGGQFRSVKDLVTGVGGAFVGLLNPMGLATTALIGLAAYASSYLLEWLTKGEGANLTIEEQQKLIQGVVSAWGDAVPELQSYLAELTKLKEINDAVAATKEFQTAQYEPLRQEIEDINVSFADFRQTLLDTGQMDALGPLNDAFQALREKIDDNQASGADAQKVLDLLDGTMVSGVRGADGLAAAIGGLIERLNGVSQASGAAGASLNDLLARGGITRSDLGGGRGSDPRELIKDEYWQRRYFPDPAPKLSIPSRSVGGGSRSSAISEAERERKAVADLIATLEFERSLIGMTEVEREKAVTLRRAGVAATDEQRQKIEELVDATYREEQAHEAAEEAIERQKDAMEQLGQIGVDAVNGLVDAFADGKLEAEELVQIVGNLVQQLLNMPSGGGGGILGSLFGGLFGGGSGFQPNTTLAGFLGVPGFAKGTNHAPGGMAIVGEKGPELVNLPRGAQVLPANMSAKAMRGGGQTVTYAPVIDARGADVAAVARLEQVLARDRAEFGAKVVSAVRTAQKRRML